MIGGAIGAVGGGHARPDARQKHVGNTPHCQTTRVGRKGLITEEGKCRRQTRLGWSRRDKLSWGRKPMSVSLVARGNDPVLIVGINS